jgi:ubiquinone/menaquinone biosynthesis C-methylase UbiE
MRVLDLGCGFGTELTSFGVSPADVVFGIDRAFEPLQSAAKSFPSRRFVQAQGEALPFRDQAFQRVTSRLALPYMNIPAALGEAARVLEPGGTVHLSLHAFRFTLYELTHIAFPKPKPLLFRLWVIGNGLVLHVTGKPASIKGRYESFQTSRGISLALRNAGFASISISRPPGRFGHRIVVDARKPAITERESPIAA